MCLQPPLSTPLCSPGQLQGLEYIFLCSFKFIFLTHTILYLFFLLKLSKKNTKKSSRKIVEKILKKITKVLLPSMCWCNEITTEWIICIYMCVEQHQRSWEISRFLLFYIFSMCNLLFSTYFFLHKLRRKLQEQQQNSNDSPSPLLSAHIHERFFFSVLNFFF